MINFERFIPLTKETKMGEIQVIKDSVENKTYANVYSICDLMNTINDKMMFYKTTTDKRIVELEKENDDFRKSIKEYEDLRKRLNKDRSRLIEEKMSLNAFVIEKGLMEEYMRWEND